MNKVILMARLVKDPETRQGDTTVSRFTVACDRFKEGADFPSCVAFGKTAEFAEKYLRKGTKVLIEGRLQTGSYQKQDGTKVYTTDVVAEHIEFAESKGSQEKTEEAPQPTVDAQGFMTIPEGFEEEGLPF